MAPRLYIVISQEAMSVQTIFSMGELPIILETCSPVVIMKMLPVMSMGQPLKMMANLKISDNDVVITTRV